MKDEMIELVEQLEAAKKYESDAKDARVAIENKIVMLTPVDGLEGSSSHSNDDLLVTVSVGLTRSCDFAALSELDSELPDHLKLVTLKPSLNLKNLRVLEKTAGERFLAGVGKAITVKPKKPSVSFKRKN